MTAAASLSAATHGEGCDFYLDCGALRLQRSSRRCSAGGVVADSHQRRLVGRTGQSADDGHRRHLEHHSKFLGPVSGG